MDTKHRTKAIRDALTLLVEDYIEDGKRHVSTFLLELEDDLDQIWTVPAERQARFLRRIQLQAAGIVEIERLRTIGLGRDAFTAALSATLKTLIRILA